MGLGKSLKGKKTKQKTAVSCCLNSMSAFQRRITHDIKADTEKRDGEDGYFSSLTLKLNFLSWIGINIQVFYPNLLGRLYRRLRFEVGLLCAFSWGSLWQSTTPCPLFNWSVTQRNEHKIRTTSTKKILFLNVDCKMSHCTKFNPWAKMSAQNVL